jgi:hypothetical protein
MEKIIKEMLFRDVSIIVAYLYRELEHKYLEAIKRIIDSDEELKLFYEDLFCTKDENNFDKNQMLKFLMIDDELANAIKDTNDEIYINTIKEYINKEYIDYATPTKDHTYYISLILWNNASSCEFTPPLIYKHPYSSLFQECSSSYMKRTDIQCDGSYIRRFDKSMKSREDSEQEHNYMRSESSLKG